MITFISLCAVHSNDWPGCSRPQVAASSAKVHPNAEGCCSRQDVNRWTLTLGNFPNFWQLQMT